MTQTLDQTEYMVEEAALANMGLAARTKLSTVFAAIDANVKKPLKMVAAMPTADRSLYISSNKVKIGDGSGLSTVPSDDTLPTYPISAINFQTGVVTGGAVLKDGGAFSLPGGSTTSYYRRVYFVYVPTSNSVNCTFSAEQALRANLTDPGQLKALLEGQDMGYIDIQATAAAEYKTADSTNPLIENAPGGVTAIYNFGSGGGGGAGGDTSFKFGTISGTNLPIKKGYMKLSDGREVYAASDLTYSLASISVDGNYYGYIDLYTLPSTPTVVSGRSLYAVTTANIIFSTTTPELQILSRYAHIGLAVRSGGVWTTSATIASKVHPIPIGVDGSLLDSLEYTLIGAVGDVAQLNSGHQLAASSFPSAAIGANLSWYNLPDLNDDSGNGKTLTDNGSVTFSTGILGDASQAVSLNGSSQYLSSLNSFFDPGNVNFCFGGWFKPLSWTPASECWLVANESGSVAAYDSYISVAGLLVMRIHNTGLTPSIIVTTDVSSLSGWHHICGRYTSTGKLEILIDGVKVAEGTGSTMQSVGAGRKFTIGAYQSGSAYFNGKVDEFFFCVGTLTDNDIMKIQAAKYVHSKGVASSSQDWKWWVKTATDAERPLEYTPVIAQTLNELFFDLSQEASTAYIARKLFNAGQSGLAKPAKGQTLTLTTDQLDAILPITHNCGAVPNLVLLVSDGTDYVTQDVGSIFKQDATQIKIAGDSLVTLFGTGINVILSYSSGVPSVFVPNKMWNKIVASSAVALAVNDRLFADAATAFVATLPANPNVGDECQILDAKGTFSITKYVTVNPGSSNLRGGANTFDCNQPNKLYRAIYVDASYGWDILY